MRAIRGRLDLFEPVVLANIALGIMFVGRPLHQLITGETTYRGYDILPTFDEALLIALIGISFFQLGYFYRPGATAWARRLPKPPPLRPQRVAMAGWLYLLIGGLLFGTFLARQGGLGLLLILLEGRQQSNNDLFLGSTGYFYNGLLLWGASALIFFAIAVVTRRRRYWLLFLAPTLCLIVFYGVRGSRSQLLPLVLAVPVFWYLWKGRRPSARTLLLAALLGVAMMGALRELRTAGENRDFAATLLGALISPVSEAAVMKRVLETQLATRVRWAEDRSLDTGENAQRSAELLRADKRRRVLLVTHAVHMRRARAAFEKAGLEPVPAPTGFFGTPVHSDWLEWLPSADGAAMNWVALHEIAGRLWYRLRESV